MTDPKEFANRVSGLILDQIDKDRAINRENIAFVVEKEAARKSEVAPEVDQNILTAAYDVLITMKRHERPSGGWGSDLRTATTHLGDLLKLHGYDPWAERKP